MRSHFRFNDGGRAASGYRGKTGDCVVRSIAIAIGLSYQHIYDLVNGASVHERTGTRKRGKSNARTGVYKSTIKRVMNSLGWVWTPTMQIGSGCTVHLRADELPAGRLVVSVSKHLTAVIDGVIHDTHDCSRRGTRCVYGYWQPATMNRPLHHRNFERSSTTLSCPPDSRLPSANQAKGERLGPPNQKSRPPLDKPGRPRPTPPPRRKSFLEWLFG
jgi:hypothetical protein